MKLPPLLGEARWGIEKLQNKNYHQAINMQFTSNNSRLKKIRQKLRNDMPKSEKVFWQKIRGRQLGVKFRRQFSIENFILDFYSPEIKLGIEIDGDSHFMSSESLLKDKNRDNILFKKYKIKTLRFTNIEVKENLEGCLEKILTEIENIPPLTPPKRGENKNETSSP